MSLKDLIFFAPHLVPHNRPWGQFPNSRDFATIISCDNTDCMCNGHSAGCAVPTKCEIDKEGRCKFYLKQKAEEAPKGRFEIAKEKAKG